MAARQAGGWGGIRAHGARSRAAPGTNRKRGQQEAISGNSRTAAPGCPAQGGHGPAHRPTKAAAGDEQAAEGRSRAHNAGIGPCPLARDQAPWGGQRLAVDCLGCSLPSPPTPAPPEGSSLPSPPPSLRLPLHGGYAPCWSSVHGGPIERLACACVRDAPRERCNVMQAAPPSPFLTCLFFTTSTSPVFSSLCLPSSRPHTPPPKCRPLPMTRPSCARP